MSTITCHLPFVAFVIFLRHLRPLSLSSSATIVTTYPSTVIVIRHHLNSSPPSSVIIFIRHHRYPSSSSSVTTVIRHPLHPSSSPSVIIFIRHNLRPSTSLSVNTQHLDSSASWFVTIFIRHNLRPSPSSFVTIFVRQHLRPSTSSSVNIFVRQHSTSWFVNILIHQHLHSSPSWFVRINFLIRLQICIRHQSPSSSVIIFIRHNLRRSPSSSVTIFIRHNICSSPSSCVNISIRHYLPPSLRCPAIGKSTITTPLTLRYHWIAIGKSTITTPLTVRCHVIDKSTKKIYLILSFSYSQSSYLLPSPDSKSITSLFLLNKASLHLWTSILLTLHLLLFYSNAKIKITTPKLKSLQK